MALIFQSHLSVFVNGERERSRSRVKWLGLLDSDFVSSLHLSVPTIGP